MIRFWVFIIFCFGINSLTLSQECPDLIAPVNGVTNVAVDAQISWEPVVGVTGYIISIGITDGGSQIINQQNVGSATTFTPPVGLPENSEIFVTITLFIFNQTDIVCASQSFFTEDVTAIPNCASLSSPLNTATNVNVASNISWNYVSGATGYRLTIGTTPGSGNIVNDLDVGNVLIYNPIVDFPFDTPIFVTIIPYNENGTANGCLEESFETGPLAVLPSCTTIISPTDGQVNIGLSPLIEWEVVAGATGYRVYIGSTPTDNDVLNGGVFFTNSTFVINFEANSVYFIRIVPFNSAGDAIECGQTSFSTVLGCGPFFDIVTGELTTLNPVLTLPTEVGLCLNEVPRTIIAPDIADGYRWFRQNANEDFVEISNTNSVQISEEGIYRYQAYNVTADPGFTTECTSSMDFTVVSSEIATVLGANVTENVSNLSIEILIEGNGDYEYALDDINGPYQDSNYFSNAPEDTSVAYIRDKNGCGIAEIDIEVYISATGFPKFFTPNGDRFNEFWQHKSSSDNAFQLEVIYIFNRYGKLLKTLNPLSKGWNGKFNGEKMPSSDYWYRAVTTEGKSIVGHFTLKY